MTIDYYALIPHPAGESLLLLKANGGWSLPRFERDDFVGARSGGLNGAIQERLGLRVTTRRSLRFHPSPKPGETTLHLAAIHSGVSDGQGVKERAATRLDEAASYLLAHGADPNHRCGAGVRSGTGCCPTLQGDTPLHLAAALADEPLVRMLLAAGADPGLANGAGQTPREFAATRSRGEIAALFL